MATTFEQVKKAAEAIQERDEKPTLASVRKELGGGSFSTLSELMKQWRASQAAQSELAEVELPDSVAGAHRASAVSIWKAAIDEADRRISGEREALKLAQEESAATVAETLEALTELESEVQELRKELDKELDEKRKLAEALSSSKSDLQSADARLRDAETRIADQQKNIDALIAKITPPKSPSK